MSISTFPSSDFIRRLSAAKSATAKGPVFVTERERPAYALLKIDDYYQLSGKREMSLLELMDSMPHTDGIEFEPRHAEIKLRDVDFE